MDRWFKRNVCEAPQSLIEKNIRKGKIKVNNKKKKSSYKLQKNDQIFVYNFDFTPNKNKRNQNHEIQTTLVDIEYCKKELPEGFTKFIKGEISSTKLYMDYLDGVFDSNLLTNEGVKFTNVYSPSGVCSPSRFPKPPAIMTAVSRPAVLSV